MNSDNNIYWSGSGIKLLNSNSYWENNQPQNNRDCVYIRKNTEKIYTRDCDDVHKYVCERY